MTASSAVALHATSGERAVFRRRLTPFLKWAGGKSQLLSQLARFLPPDYRVYIEPFLGGGAVALALEPERAILADSNEELITCYRVIRDHLDALLADLERHRYDQAYYYALRACQPGDLTPVQRASRFIYLNKTGYNGLYRVNARGQFNVPFGRYKSPPRLVQPENLRGVQALLQRAEICVAPYQETMDRAQSGDWLYLDPPYHPLSATARFTAYTAGSFTARDQEDLARWYRELDRRGCRLLLSNSNTPLIRDLYHAFRIEEVRAMRSINSDPEARGAVTELVILNY
jgi:DNA adenine methylase